MRDQYGRMIDYVRISVTDRCNLRCRYCMPPGGIASAPCEEILCFKEILRLAGLFAQCGIKKVKLTGGEPLVRKDIPLLVRGLKVISGIDEVTLTTNGLLLLEQLPALVDAGIDGINLSLDTLDEARYRMLTGSGSVKQVLAALDACLGYRHLRVKVNVVTLAAYNQCEIGQLAGLAKHRRADVRFIEMMPMGAGKDFAGYTQKTVADTLEKMYGKLEPVPKAQRGNGPAVYYKLQGFQGRIGMISAMTHMFCESCNRIRLTSTGFLKPCLHHGTGTDLRYLLRNGAADAAVADAIAAAILAKPQHHVFCEANAGDAEMRKMYEIGG